MNKIKRTCALLLAIVLTLGVVLQSGIGGVFAEHTQETEQTTESTIEPATEPEDETETAGYSEVAGYAETETEKTETMAVTDPNDYIYFDLAAGNVTIGSSTYTGSVFVNGTETLVTGEHNAENKYYVYQSNLTDSSSAGYYKNTGYKNTDDCAKHKNCTVPSYPRVSYNGEPWTEFIENNDNVKKVSEAWETAAPNFGRKALGEQAKNGAAATGNRIIFEPESEYTADVTIDNIWTYFQEPGNRREKGGITAHLVTKTDTKIYLRLKGDNRLGNIHYGANMGTKNQIIFLNGEDANQTSGSITVADFPMDFNKNRWCSAIGGDDSICDRSDGIVIDSGVIYAGTTSADDCTAIGGGGNAFGRVTIGGGIVTAVSASTGTAIGGGIGWGDIGGDAEVTISDGTVYAYNHGIGPDSGNYVSFVPAAAIGGRSASTNSGNKSTSVTIKGGTVYAQSVGGTAIGGGGSGTKAGGDADVTISGGTVIAKSISKEVNYNLNTNKNHTENVSAGVSIGGGTGDTGGGNVTLNISGKNTILRTGSIGGGKTTGSGTIGSAKVEINGGDITGQVIMAGTGDKSNICSFNMDGGTLHGTNVVDGNTITDIKDPNKDAMIEYIEKNGGAVWMNDSEGVTDISGGTIEKCTAELGGAIYMNGGTFTLSGEGKISGNTAKTTTDTETNAVAGGMGGGIYVTGGTANINGGTIDHNTASVDNGDSYVTKGGGVYLEGGNVTMTGGNIEHNEAKNGGGVYLAKGKSPVNPTEGETPAEDDGIFTLDGENAIISNNTATNGGGIYLYKSPKLEQGKIEGNQAGENGGGMYISDCLVVLKPKTATKEVFITGNKANKNGAGIYISSSSGSAGSSGSTESLNSEVDAISSATFNKDSVGLLVDRDSQGKVHFTNNVAKDSGGAVCVNGGRFYLESDKIDVTGNEAKNGGGVAVLNGNFNISDGSIGEENGANTSTENGGGVYVSGGEVWFKGGSIKYNKAKNGGGACVNGGKFIMKNGSLTNNTADESGGGAYVDGEFSMVDGTIGDIDAGNHATDGGGVYVANGNITVVNGKILYNSVTNNGGGFLVSATEGDVKVVMLSGELSHNTAGNNGGGMAVESHNNRKINIEIGCLLDHKVTDGKPKLPINYEGAYEDYANYYEVTCNHASCPKVQYNRAGQIGGGFYMNSDSSSLYFYCVEETENSAQSANSGGMDVLGGNVIIGDSHYHNHDYNNNNNTDKREKGPWGYISMDDATLVNGGQVDIYGDLTNPTFKNEIVVDIKDQNDHFVDHRRAYDDEKIYKVHYFENFQGTGRFESHDYHEGNTVITVKGAIFSNSHPGYKILGWYTKDTYNPAENDPDNTFYEVGQTFDLSKADSVPQMGHNTTTCTQCGVEHNDTNLLVLYAIWEANGYTVVFNPNVPHGETYTGSMENQIHQYGVPQKLTSNGYKYKGHIFNGWNTQADGKGTSFADGAEVSNLTDKNGVEVVLYAQWTPCDHKNPSQWTYDVINDGKTLRRICSCGGQTLTATLYAEDTVYDGLSHSATLTLDDKEAWGNDAPIVQYKGERLKEEDVTKYGELMYDNNIPYHAGKYTASITKKNGETPVTASVKYTIAKAEQDAPATPTYNISKDLKTVQISKLAHDIKEFTDKGNRTHKAKAEYCLTYTGDSGIAWKTFSDDNPEQKTLDITLTNALTHYIIQARYQELEDYNASDITKAAEGYFFEGNVKVKIICDEGIECTNVIADKSNNEINGVTLTLALKPGYYLVGGKYDVNATLQLDNDETPTIDMTVKQNSDVNSEYSVTDIQKDSTLTIYIGTAKKSPVVKSKVMPGQKFSAFTGAETTISRDSAFTAAFQIINFDPSTYDVPELTFASNIPKNTTIILLNRVNGTYWYYCAKNEVSLVKLNEFKEMGGTEAYSVPEVEGNAYIDLSYQFIVDFSRTGGAKSTDGYLDNSLKMTLEAPIGDTNSNVKAPKAKSDVNVKMSKSDFTLEETPVSGLTKSFKCTFEKEADASKWENRASALVLKPSESDDLPPDVQIKAEVEGGGTTYLYKSGDSFIVPLPLLEAVDKDIEVTLQSALFPASEDKNYSFTAQWLISPSEAGKAPFTGDQTGDKPLEVIFTSAKKVAPSLKIMEGCRNPSVGDTLKVGINTQNMTDYTISAELLRKSDDGKYEGIGWNKPNVSETDGVSITLGGYLPGSYCLKFTVKENGADSITIVMEVPYYFVVKEP